jgi:hypothetical protein
MIRKLSLAKRIHVWWIAVSETRRLAVMATMPIRDMEAYAQKQNLPESLKQQILAVVVELSAGRKPYRSINAVIDGIIETKVPGFRTSYQPPQIRRFHSQPV